MKELISKQHVNNPVKWDIVIHNLLDILITSTVDFLIKLYIPIQLYANFTE